MGKSKKRDEYFLQIEMKKTKSMWVGNIMDELSDHIMGRSSRWADDTDEKNEAEQVEYYKSVYSRLNLESVLKPKKSDRKKDGNLKDSFFLYELDDWFHQLFDWSYGESRGIDENDLFLIVDKHILELKFDDTQCSGFNPEQNKDILDFLIERISAFKDVAKITLRKEKIETVKTSKVLLSVEKK